MGETATGYKPTTITQKNIVPFPAHNCSPFPICSSCFPAFVFLGSSAEIYYMSQRQLLGSGATKQCRICLQSGDISNLSTPCSCKGSIQYVHRNCLKEYFVHRFKTANRAQRRKMKQRLSCQICKQPIKGLEIRSARRCATCEEVKDSLEIEDVFFLVLYAILYIGFHVVGIVIIVQDTVLAKIIGAVWLSATVIAFNYGLYKIIRKLFTIREAQVMEITEDEEEEMLSV